MALQRFGRADMACLLDEMQVWSQGNWWEKRAVAAALAEPDLLKAEQEIIQAFELLEAITNRITQAVERNSESYRGLRQSLGYCWSVLTAALPKEGKRRMEKLASGDILWVTYYKSTSKFKTDIHRDSINAYSHTLGMEGVAMISIDQDWSALRLKVFS